AIQRQCTKVLTVLLTRKAAGGGNSKVGAAARAAGTAAGYIGVSGVAEIAVAGAAAGAPAVGDLPSTTRAEDEARIEYRRTTVDGGQIFAPRTDSARARSNGEDLITPLVSKASDVIAAAVSKK